MRVMTDPEPTIVERSSVPRLFPYFRNSASLAYLAHCRRGPRYVLIGGKAWYDVADIRGWIEQNKQSGPNGHRPANSPLPAPQKKRGRPSKLEQYRRRVRDGLEKAAGTALT
jgi:hypothetical protein